MDGWTVTLLFRIEFIVVYAYRTYKYIENQETQNLILMLHNSKVV